MIYLKINSWLVCYEAAFTFYTKFTRVYSIYMNFICFDKTREGGGELLACISNQAQGRGVDGKLRAGLCLKITGKMGPGVNL